MFSGMFQYIGYLRYILKYVLDLNDNHNLKRAFADEIEPDLVAFEDAYLELLMSLYLTSGAFLVGTIIPPNETEIAIDKITETYLSSIAKMENSFVQLVKTLKVHESDVYQIIGNKYSNKMLMNNLLASVDVEQKTIDWDYLSRKNSLMRFDSKNIYKTEFPKKLNESLTPFTDEMQINNVVWDNINLKNIEVMENLWLNKEFRRDCYDLLKKYLD